MNLDGGAEPPNSIQKEPDQGKPAPVSKAATSATTPFRPGSTLGRWTLLKPLARGGMGEVYLATSGGIEGAERPCVVKLIRREHARDKSFLARFFDEARIQAQFQHPGVAQVFEASTDERGMPYVVLEYIEGRNLGEVRQRAAQLGVPLGWADAVAICVSLAEALAHVHERTDAQGEALSIVHRDVSPQNVMLGYGGDVKLIDFGTARGENRRCQTVAGVVFAKPGYVAPEVANETPGGIHADIYALGIILWELIMGRKFLTGDPQEHLAEVAAGRRAPPAVSLTNNVPLELDTAIARMTAFDLRDRHATAREVMTTLLRVLKRAPSLADGERGVRARIAYLMARLYPAEPARTRSEFVRLLTDYRSTMPRQPDLSESPSPSPTGDELFPGTRYKLEGEISRTPMSVVYEALHVDLLRRVALKVLPREHCKDPRFERRFRTEARALAKVHHPNLVQLHDSGVSLDGRPYYAMELLSGETLQSHTAEQRLSWQEAFEIGAQIAGALSAVHQQGIVHRDVKPDNVFITDDGGVKLLDFGVARILDAEPEREDGENSGALQLVGTVEYMAPEQIGEGTVDPRADVYAVGAVLYQLVTCELPHCGEGTVELLDKKRRDMPVPPRRRAKLDAPFDLDLVLLKALAPKPEQRFASADQFEQALRRVLGAPLRKKRRRQQALVLAASALFAGASFMGYRWLDAVGWNTAGWLSPALKAEPALLAAPPEPVEAIAAFATDPAAAHAELVVFKEPSEALDQGQQPHDDPNVPVPALAEEDPVNEATNEASAAADSDPGANVAPTAPRDSETPLQAPAPSAEFQETLLRAQRLANRADGVDRALALFRELGEQQPENVELLEGWSKTAAKAQWWGESLQVAIRWAALDPGEEAQLHLAKTQRLIGQRYSAIQTLERLLQEAPQNPRALALLERYRVGR